jgi:hypothetical protein
VNQDLSFCTLITEVANFLPDFVSLLSGRIKARDVENGRWWTRVGSMLHDRKHFAYFPFHSRTLQPTYRHLFNDPLSPSKLRALYSAGLQLAKIDRVKVHDGADHIGFLLCVSSDAWYPRLFSAPHLSCFSL